MVAALAVVVVPSGAQAATYPGIGELSFSTFETVPLSEWMELRVNVAAGNLMLNAHDLAIQGTGVDLAVSRFVQQPTHRPVGGHGCDD